MASGSPLAGMYLITRGRVQLQREGKPVHANGGGKLASGQYFGEAALCTAHDQVSYSLRFTVYGLECGFFPPRAPRSLCNRLGQL